MHQRHRTRSQFVEWLNENGYPISNRYFEKLCVPSGGEGPRVDKWFGGRALYLESDLRAWAESRCRPGDRASNAGEPAEALLNQGTPSGRAA